MPKRQYYRITPKDPGDHNKHAVVFACLSCTVSGVDEDMNAELKEVEEKDETITTYCEMCGKIIAEGKKWPR